MPDLTLAELQERFHLIDPLKVEAELIDLEERGYVRMAAWRYCVTPRGIAASNRHRARFG